MRHGKLFLVLLLLAAWLSGCGAQNKPGPPPLPKPQKCQSLDALAPALMEVLKGAGSVKLRTLTERERLWDTQSDGSPSPIITILKVTLATLKAFAADPPEPGAPEGQLCNEENPPPSRDSNRMCEARRILQIFVREGKGIEALHLLDPFIARILGYVVGASIDEPHYDVARVFAATCSKAYCRTEDALDLVVGLISFLEPTAEEPDRTRDVLSLVHRLLAEPGARKLLDTTETHMDEEALISFGHMLMENLASLPSEPDRFVTAYQLGIEVKVNDLFTTFGVDWTSPEYLNLRLLLDQVLGAHDSTSIGSEYPSPRPLLLDLLDPARPEPVLQPLKAQVSCLMRNDPTSSLLRLIFDLSYKTDAIGLDEILGALEGLAEIDAPGRLITFLKRALQMIRDDEEGTAAARRLCSRALDTSTPEGGGPSNAELVLPAAADLFGGGALGEVVCVVDTLLFGCVSGSQPACAPSIVP